MPFVPCWRLLTPFLRRENTVLRAQLFEKDEDDPTKLAMKRNVYVIPNAILSEMFRPSPPPPSDTST